jgi:hypothetical protein
MPILYPQINGIRYDFSTIEANLDGQIFNGIREVTYRHELTPGELSGTRAQLIGRTRGKYRPEGSLTFYKLEYQDFIRRLAARGGYMEVSFDVVVNYQPSPTSADIVTDVLKGCRIKNAENSHSEGEEALIVKADLHIMYILESGLTPLDAAQFLK